MIVVSAVPDAPAAVTLAFGRTFHAGTVIDRRKSVPYCEVNGSSVTEADFVGNASLQRCFSRGPEIEGRCEDGDGIFPDATPLLYRSLEIKYS